MRHVVYPLILLLDFIMGAHNCPGGLAEGRTELSALLIGKQGDIAATLRIHETIRVLFEGLHLLNSDY
jgi:hypothetical protein